MRRRLPGLLLPTAPPTAVLVRVLGASVLMAVMPSAVAPAADTVAPAQATAAVAAAVEYRFNLAPAPSPFAGHQGYYNASAWSWGGSLIHVPDDAAFPFHMFAEAELGACGVHAWQTNARVVHAVSKLAEGPYEWRDDPLPAGQWHAGPDISRASDGTFLLMTMNSNATAAHCVDGVGNFSCPPDPATGKLPKPGYPCIHSGLFRNRMYASHSPYGPWDEVHNASGGDVIPASINANAVAHPLPNGTVLIVGGGIHVAPSWSGPYSRVNRGLELNDPTTGRAYDFKSCPLDPRNAAAHAKWPKATCALEDIFVWFDPARLRWRWMAHQKLKGAGDRGLHQCDYFPGVGGFAQSDSENFWGSWTYDFWAPAYGLYSRLSNGTDYCLESRERPVAPLPRPTSSGFHSMIPQHALKGGVLQFP